MKLFLACFIILLCSSFGDTASHTYVGSTPAHEVIRKFLAISLTDSIDFIRWKLEMGASHFKLQCEYGLGKPGTPGFWNPQHAAFEGEVTKSSNRYVLRNKGRQVSMREVDINILHFLDANDHMLSGNGGYSYALNSTAPVKSSVTIQSAKNMIRSPLVFEGRTPCQELSAQLGMDKGAACDKMKWYFLLYSDSVTGKPSYFLMAGIGYRKESMKKGRWEISTESNGHIVYRLYADIWSHPLTLLKGDEDILFFMGSDGRLLVGNENFSYTLNRQVKEHSPLSK